MDRTLTSDERERPPTATAPALCAVLACEHLERTPQWFSLADVDTVQLARAEDAVAGLRAERTSDPVMGRTLTLTLADARVSRPHAKLEVRGHSITVIDQESKNGTSVNGDLVTRMHASDGAVLEVGRTFFVVRTHAPLDLAALPFSLAPPGAARALSTASPSFAQALSAVPALAQSTTSLILAGDTGTGKEVLARLVHALSDRSGAFVAVNCGALPAELVEAELFGAKRGAYSGAATDRLGMVRASDGGTLFLDEIGDLPLAAQPALLRVLQEREVVPVGASAPVPVDLRVVCASHRDLAAEVDAGRFRADLFARLHGAIVRLPPLAERTEDLGLLASAFLPRGTKLTARAGRALMLARYAGNVRALEQALTAAVALARGGTIDVEHLPALASDPAQISPSVDLRDSGGDDEALAAQLRALLAEHHGNVSAVARAMGKARMQVYRWLERTGIDPRTFS
ncbi:MAG TPA: sigma 54-interacting transcriptional regulator [Myxococcota bacterium]